MMFSIADTEKALVAWLGKTKRRPEGAVVFMNDFDRCSLPPAWLPASLKSKNLLNPF